MKTIVLLGVLVVSAAAAPAAENGARPVAGPPVEVSGGTVAFAVATNVPAVSVHGESEALRASVRLRHSPGGVVLEEVEAIVPVHSLKTGIAVRDGHMRNRIFTTKVGQVPDLRFVARGAACPPAAARRDTVCRVAGELAIRGVTRPFAMVLTVAERNGTFKVSGDGEVKLSAYAIPRPSQLMVTTADVVKLRVSFVARPAGMASMEGGSR
jgi:polyisoprenoid-binding protein YceI